MADPIILAWLAWVSSALTMAGVAIAILQIKVAIAEAKKATDAAQSAKRATEKIVSIVREKEKQLKIDLAKSHLENARLEWLRDPRSSLAYLLLCSAEISSLLELLDSGSDEKKLARSQRTRVNALVLHVTETRGDGSDPVHVGTHISQMNKIINTLEEMSSRVRYRYGGAEDE